MNRYRHEFKYFLNSRNEQLLRIRAAGLLQPDAHAASDGTYLVRSLYFDDIQDSCLRENLAGTDPRSKFRIRYYNQDTAHLRLEKKSKTCGMTLKESCAITRDECRMFLHGQVPCITADMDPVKQKLFAQMQLRSLSPKVIVTYERVPYVYPGGNVRVTFDRMLSSSVEIEAFLDGSYVTRPVFPLGQSLLEVKWDEVLPNHIRDALQLEELSWTAFSKYGICRTYHL